VNTKAWVQALNRNDPDYEHHLLEALWVHQWHNVVDADLLTRVLRSPEPRARAAAGRVLCYWRDRLSNSLEWFRTLANDEHPRVRLEAVRGASFYRTAAAAEMALEILKYPTDYYLDYVLKETLRQLQPWWRKAIAEGQPIAPYNPAGLEYLIDSVNTTELLRLPRTRSVLEALVTRAGVADADRAAALVELAKLRGEGRVDIVLAALDTDDAASASIARLLPMQWPEELKEHRAHLAELAAKSPKPEIRQAAWSSLAVADDSFEGVWSEANRSLATLTDLIGGIPLLVDPAFRARAYDRVAPLLAKLPDKWKAEPGTQGRFVRVELPRRGTLTLAEVEVFSGGRNIAPAGTPTQSSTANEGVASRAIDGRTNGDYASGTQTHTRENQRQPWWELDLGREHPLDSITIWNRTEGDLGRRLEGFTLSVLDGERRPVVTLENQAAPKPNASIELHRDPLGALRRAAIEASVSMNREPEAVFSALARMIARGEEVPAAAQGLRILPRAKWPRAEIGPATTGILAWAKGVPAEARTSLEFVETIQFADDMAGYLPADNARAVRGQLRDLRVAVFVIRTVREQMRYDTPRIVVETDKPFEIIVENADFMPHNLVIVKPGARERVGATAASFRPDHLDSEGRAYVPETPDVLAATRLLESGQTASLRLRAPRIAGDYEYVCTFPGHHQVMWGWLIVTDDIEAYLQENPEARSAGEGGSSHTDHHFE
jgi:azurin